MSDNQKAMFGLLWHVGFLFALGFFVANTDPVVFIESPWCIQVLAIIAFYFLWPLFLGFKLGSM